MTAAGLAGSLLFARALFLQGGMPRNTALLVGLVLLGLLAAVVVVSILVILIRRRGTEKDLADHMLLSDAERLITGATTIPGEGFGFQPAGVLVGRLHILASEDPMMAGKKISLTQHCTTIGRGAENDIVLPWDKSVSRRHAMIERSGTDFYLNEIVSQELGGEIKRPPFGTYLNQQQISHTPVPLKTGDEIRLGTHFRMQFEKLAGEGNADAADGKILDHLNPDGDETLTM